MTDKNKKEIMFFLVLAVLVYLGVRLLPIWMKQFKASGGSGNSGGGGTMGDSFGNGGRGAAPGQRMNPYAYQKNPGNAPNPYSGLGKALTGLTNGQNLDGFLTAYSQMMGEMADPNNPLNTAQTQPDITTMLQEQPLSADAESLIASIENDNATSVYGNGDGSSIDSADAASVFGDNTGSSGLDVSSTMDAINGTDYSGSVDSTSSTDSGSSVDSYDMASSNNDGSEFSGGDSSYLDSGDGTFDYSEGY